MIDHITIRVSDLEASTTFYEAVLGTVGYTNGGTFGGAVHFTIGEEHTGDIWIYESVEPTQKIHIAVSAPHKEAVQAFHAAGLKAGGESNGEPGIRDEYAPNYYGAYLLDPDGNNIEAVAFIAE